MKYNIHVRQDCTYWGIEADNADEALEIAIQSAIEDGGWDYNVEKVEEDDEEELKNE